MMSLGTKSLRDFYSGRSYVGKNRVQKFQWPENAQAESVRMLVLRSSVRSEGGWNYHSKPQGFLPAQCKTSHAPVALAGSGARP